VNRTNLRAAFRHVGIVVLVVSGIYVLVYLYRWEWHRALLSGLFFVGAEVMVIGTVLADRLQAMDRRIDRLAQRAPPPAGGERPDPFRWLDPTSGRMGVFLPILLGAGMLLSAIAYLVERLARFAAGTGTLDQTRLRALAVPRGDLLGAPPPAPPPPSRSRRGVIGVVTLLLAALVAGGMFELMALSQSRPDPNRPGWVTTVDLELRHKVDRTSTAAAAQTLVVLCRPKGDVTVTVVEVDEVKERVLLQLSPALGRTGQRKLAGCLGDEVLDYVRGRVISVSSGPAPS
jgi:hypothetical protein